MVPQISLGVHFCVCSPDLPFPGCDRGRRRLLHSGRVLRQRGSLTGIDSCEAPGRRKRPVSGKACHVQGQGWIRHKGLTPEPGLAHRAGAQSRRSRPEHSGARMQTRLVGGSRWRGESGLTTWMDTLRLPGRSFVWRMPEARRPWNQIKDCHQQWGAHPGVPSDGPLWA